MTDLVKSSSTSGSSVVYPATPLRQGWWLDEPLDKEEDSISFERYFRALVKRRLLIGAIALAAVVLTFLQMATTTRLYSTTALVQVDPEQGGLAAYDESGSRAVARSDDEFLMTQARKLRTRTLALQVIERQSLLSDERFNERPRQGILIEPVAAVLRGLRKLARGSEGTMSPENEAIRRILDNLEVGAVRDTRLLEVRYTSPYPDLAAAIATGFAHELIEQENDNRRDAAIRATGFLKGQLDEVKAAVAESERKLVQYTQSRGILGVSESSVVSLQKLADLTEAATRAETAMEKQAAAQRAIAAAGDGGFPAILQNSTLTELERRKSELEQKRSQLSVSQGDGWPEVMELTTGIEGLDAQIREEQRRAIATAKEEYQFARDSYAGLTKASNAHKELIDESSAEYSILKREADTDKTLYQGMLQRFREAGIVAGLPPTNIQVVDEAPVPTTPGSPNKLAGLAMALFFGLFLGVGVALTAEVADRTIRGGEDLQRDTGLPSLAHIPPLTKTVGRTALLGARRRDEGPVHTLLDKDVDTAAWEPYRWLRTSLLLANKGEAVCQAMVVTSAISGDGKTTSATNLGITLARTGARTLLVDLDLHSRALSQHFGLQDQPGVSTFLTDASEGPLQARALDVENLSLLPAGPARPTAAELIGSVRMAKLMRALREQFNYIVIDTPASIELTDAVLLAPLVDGFILVARAGWTPREALLKVRDNLSAFDARVFGIVVNDVDTDPGEYYGRSYAGRS